MARPLWFVQLLKKTFPQIKFIAKLTRLPLIGKIIDDMLFEGDDILYLPKEQVLTINKDLREQEDVILPSKILEHFINESSHRRIMNFCICRDSLKCKDYPIELGCLFLGKATKGISPEISREVTKEEALEHVKKCREAGLIHLIGRNKLDAVWLNVGPGNKLLTICNCCPCCCLWRVLPHVSKKIGGKVTKLPGVEVTISDKCIGCGTCTDTCFVNAITIQDKKAIISTNCRGCGRCVEKCPQKAIIITIPSEATLKQSINHITLLVNVK